MLRKTKGLLDKALTDKCSGTQWRNWKRDRTFTKHYTRN